MKNIQVLWKFSRPHTVIGSIISILTLYMIICEKSAAQHYSLLLLALVIGVCSNVFMVGINQVADVHIDRINKPYLPIAAGTLSMRQAKCIVLAALLLSLILALFISFWLFGLVFFASCIGWAYSMPPFHMKRHHFTAALAILLVRGLIINIGAFIIFNHLVNGSLVIPVNVRILAVFIVVFSIVIAWFKDLPDVKGDAAHNIRTLSVLYSPRMAFRAGNILLGLAYLFTIAFNFREMLAPGSTVRDSMLFYGHILLLLLFTGSSRMVILQDSVSVQKFYRRFWWFFFAEYLLYMLSYLPGYL